MPATRQRKWNFRSKNMPVLQEITKGKVPVRIFTRDIEPQAYQQLANIASLPVFWSSRLKSPDVQQDN